jgi:hypothetical protein
MCDPEFEMYVFIAYGCLALVLLVKLLQSVL